MVAAIAGMPGGYPVLVEFDEQEPINRLWGIPIVGHVARAIILIPHVIVLWGLSIAVGLSVLVLWIPILVNGRAPHWAYWLIGGTYRYSTRASAYWLMLTDTYPPFQLEAPHPVQVFYVPDQPINRAWGIPFFGYWLRGIILIPHAIALWILGIGVIVAVFVSWIPILTGGRMPRWGYDLMGGTLRWGTRVAAYTLMLTDVYPPFRLRP